MRTSCHYEAVLGWQLEEYEVGVRWSSLGKDMSPGAEERLLLENVTKQCSKDHD
jgi:hypothetical protein